VIARVLLRRVVLVLTGIVAVGSALPTATAGSALPAAMAGLAQLVVMRSSQQPVDGSLRGPPVLAKDGGEHRPQRERRQEPDDAAAGSGTGQRLAETIDTPGIHQRTSSGRACESRRWRPAAAQAVAIVDC
jgi:hypothetical protein